MENWPAESCLSGLHRYIDYKRINTLLMTIILTIPLQMSGAINPSLGYVLGIIFCALLFLRESVFVKAATHLAFVLKVFWIVLSLGGLTTCIFKLVG